MAYCVGSKASATERPREGQLSTFQERGKKTTEAHQAVGPNARATAAPVCHRHGSYRQYVVHSR